MRARVGAVAVHAQRQRLEALQEQEGVERADSTGPRSRIVSTRAFMMNAKLPNVSCEAHAAVARRRLGDARGSGPRSQAYVPPSTITPPIDVPWPPMNFVAEWITMCAPCSNGRHRYGVAKVLSIISGSPCVRGDLRPSRRCRARRCAGCRSSRRTAAACAASIARAHRVEVVRVDEARRDAEARELRSRAGCACRRRGSARRRSRRPGPSSVSIAIAPAARPDAVASAPTPPSSEAMRSSNAAVVGLTMRV